MRPFSAGLRDRLAGAVRPFLLLVCGVLGAAALLNAQIYASRTNLFEMFFKDATESIIIQFKDGDIFIYSTLEIGRVTVDPAQMVDHLVRQKGKKLSDIIQITHNHFSEQGFTREDEAFCRYLEERGFTGDFCIYHTQSKKVETRKANVRRK